MDQLNILLESAANYCAKGEYQQGIHLYSQYIKENNKDAKAYYQRGKAYFKIKDYNAAVSNLNKAMKLAPDDAHLTGERGLIYFMAEKKDKAMDDFNTAVKLDPKNPFRYASRAFIKDRLNDLEGAKEDYQKALEIDPEDAISYNNLGLVLDKMGYRKKAADHFDKAAEIDPKSFGMRKSANSGTETKREILADSQLPPLPQIAKTEETRNTANFIDTVKNLVKSPDERTAFWEFVKQKFKG